jgi:hypothetical protein
MPRISEFYGIVIWLYRADHLPAHFHAQYGEHWAKVAIGDARLIDGSLPARAMRMVREWTRLHRAELVANWRHAQGDDPLEPIAPLP